MPSRSIVGWVQRQFLGVLANYQRALPTSPALLGDGHGTVSVAGHPGFVWIRLGFEGEDGLGMAYNQTVPLRDGLAVIVGYRSEQPALFQVLAIREVYVGTRQSPVPQVRSHHASHEYPTLGDSGADGSDIVYVHPRQVRYLRVYVFSRFTVVLERGPLYRGTGYRWIDEQSLNLTMDKPAGGGRYVLLYVSETGIFSKRLGPVVAAGDLNFEAHCPIPNPGEYACAAVALYRGQLGIQETSEVQDIIDLRYPPTFSAGGEAMGDDTLEYVWMFGR